MSPIGRVFIVINLILAGAFVMMAGTFLQRHTDWKVKYDDVVKAHEAAKAEHEGTISQLRSKNGDQEREILRITSTLDQAQVDNKGLTEENQRLESQLADLGSDIKSLNSRAATMSDAIDRSTSDSKQALEMAMEATQAREAALNEKEAAEASLSQAKREVTDLEEQLAEAKGQIASLEQTNKEQEVMLSYIAKRFPGATALAQPDLSGVVEQAQGQICTVRISNNPSEAEIKPGYTMAIYSGNTYKGEAVITEVEGEFAFCRVTSTQDGQVVAAGDAAATNVGN